MLKRNGGAYPVSGRTEDDECLVPADLDESAASAVDDVLDDLGEGGSKASGRLVAVLLGVPRVAPDVGAPSMNQAAHLAPGVLAGQPHQVRRRRDGAPLDLDSPPLETLDQPLRSINSTRKPSEESRARVGRRLTRTPPLAGGHQ
jgi:hypothetical protein